MHENSIFSRPERWYPFFLLLLQAPGYGPIRQRALVEAHVKRGDPDQGPSDELISHVESLFDRESLRAARVLAEREWALCQEKRIRVVSCWDPDYPPLLLQCRDAPLLLFLTSIPDWKHRPLLSVVGTRSMTSYGRGLCAEIMEAVRIYNPLVVSGFAKGVDIEIQRRAVESGLETLAVFAHGLGCTYPQVHLKYRGAIQEQGALLTEFLYNQEPRRLQFVKRNRIISGISEATVVVESGWEGGSLSTARLAFDYDRIVLAVPGSVHDPFSQGCHRLLAEQVAVPVCRMGDIPELLGWAERFPKVDIPDKRAKTGVERGVPAHIKDTETAKILLAHLKDCGTASVGTLAAVRGQGMQEIAQVLVELEIAGLIRKNANYQYELK